MIISVDLTLTYTSQEREITVGFEPDMIQFRHIFQIMARSSSGPGHGVLNAEIAGSNPARATLFGNIQLHL